jgi:UDP-N-acetylglucosamine diphosphorylase/glucosamine-1-phosphate N-acetyltransferase
MGDVGAIILAAGKGTRMHSEQAKVLHEICDVPMIQYVVEAALSVMDDVTVVIGHQAETVKRALSRYPNIRFAFQEKQLGTGHAVLTALEKLPESIKKVTVLCGDTPLIKKETLARLIRKHNGSNGYITVLGTRLENPFGYGRIICRDKRQVVGIVEEADASKKQKGIQMINSGTYCIDVGFLRSALPDLDCKNAQKEFYLTDIVALADKRHQPALLVEALDSLEVLGVNTPQDLATAQDVVTRAMRSGCENPLDFCTFN